MAVQAKGKKKKGRKHSRQKGVRPLDADFFEFADKVSLVFDQPYAGQLRFRLFEEASAYRNRYRPHKAEDFWATKTKWTTFLLRLILACPRILSRPPDFEWVMDDLEWLLARRKFDPAIDRDFWDALKRIRGPIRTGHPRNRALEHFRFDTVEIHMNPPAPLKDIVDTCGKEEALRRAADIEEQCLGKRPHERVVRRSYDRVKQELKELHDLLRGASSLTPSPRYQSDGESQKTAKETSNRRRPSRRSKRERRN